MKIFLVPVDFSKKSDNALAYTVELARKEKSKILLLHVLNNNHSISGIIGLMITDDLEIIEKNTAKRLQNMCNEVNKIKNVQCEFIYKTGDIIGTILETIEYFKPNMVVMGTRGATGLNGNSGDSCTAKLIEKTKYPVMAIPEHVKYNDLRKITFVTNYHKEDIRPLKVLLETAKPCKAQINSIHISDNVLMEEAEMGKLKNFSNYVTKNLNYHNLSFQLIQGETVEKEVQEHAVGTTTNLLALAHSNDVLKDGGFGINITKKMLYNSDVPFMVINYN